MRSLASGPMREEAAAERERCRRPRSSRRRRRATGVPNVHSSAPSGSPARASMKSRAAVFERRIAPRRERRVAGLPDEGAVAAVPRHRRHVARAEIPQVAQAAIRRPRRSAAPSGLRRSAVLYSTTAHLRIDRGERGEQRLAVVHRHVVDRRLAVEDHAEMAERGLRAGDRHAARVVVARRARRGRSRTASRRRRGAMRPCDDQMRSRAMPASTSHCASSS